MFGVIIVGARDLGNLKLDFEVVRIVEFLNTTNIQRLRVYVQCIK